MDDTYATVRETHMSADAVRQFKSHQYSRFLATEYVGIGSLIMLSPNSIFTVWKKEFRVHTLQQCNQRSDKPC